MILNEILLKVHSDVVNQHPNAAFYEAQGMLIKNDEGKIDGTIERDTFLAAYCLIGNNQTIIAKIDEEGKTNIMTYASPWIEDRIMTPYVPLEVDDAIMLINKKFDKEVIEEGQVSLRFQLFPNEIEPRYFFGNFIKGHSVGVYSRLIDQPLKRLDGDVVPKNNDDIYNFYEE